MMSVWIKLTRKRVRCRHCEKYIEVGEYHVVCQYWMKMNSGRNWVKRMHFHAKDPYCWVEQGITVLKSKPQVETRGRKRAEISDENRAQREAIMRRRSSTMQRLRAEMDGKQRWGVVERLSEKLESYKEDIEPYGGAPKGW